MHCAHRNPAVPDFFDSEYMVRDSVVHEVDVARFLLDEEISSVQILRGVATSAAPAGTSDPMLVVFETESGRLVTDEIYVRSGVAYEVRTEVVGEQGSAMIGLDQNLQMKTTDGRWGGRITPSFVERFGQAYDTELQRWVDAARAGTIDGPGRVGRVRRRRRLRGRRPGPAHGGEGRGRPAAEADRRARARNHGARSRGRPAMNISSAQKGHR